MKRADDAVPDSGEVVLWFRETKRHRWIEIGRAATGPAALALMDASGKRNGLWQRLPAGRDPNDKHGEPPP